MSLPRVPTLAIAALLAALGSAHACRRPAPSFQAIRLAWWTDLNGPHTLWALGAHGETIQIDPQTGSWTQAGPGQGPLGRIPRELDGSRVASHASASGLVTAFTGNFGIPRRYLDGQEVPWDTPSNVYELAVHPHGHYIALSDLFFGLQLYHADSPQPVLVIPTGESPVTAMQWGRGGTRLVVAQDDEVTLYEFAVEESFLGGEAPTLRPIARASLERRVQDVAISMGSRVLVASDDEPTGVLELVDGELKDTGLRIGAPGARLLAPNPNGSEVAIAGRTGSLRIFDADTGEIEAMVLPGR